MTVLGAGFWGLGLGLTAMVTTIEYLVWGRSAVVTGVTFGLIATGIQAAAIRVAEPGLKRFAVGFGLRLGGVVLFVIAVLADRALFPPLPTALGYLGVVIPLLFAETRLAQ